MTVMQNCQNRPVLSDLRPTLIKASQGDTFELSFFFGGFAFRCFLFFLLATRKPL